MAIVKEIVESPTQDDVKGTERIPGEDSEDDTFYDSAEYQLEEFKRLVQDATEHKEKANRLFAEANYDVALIEYDKALSVCPASQVEQRAIIYCNKGACFFKKEDYSKARDQCTEALTLDPTYVNARSRRARANEKTGTYTALSDALKDYEALLQQGSLPKAVKDDCIRAKRDLPGAVQKQMEKEKEEMMGKLKDLGNTILGKFNLSTDNFVFDKDPNSGNYSMNFVNQPSRSSQPQP